MKPMEVKIRRYQPHVVELELVDDGRRVEFPNKFFHKRMNMGLLKVVEGNEHLTIL